MASIWNPCSGRQALAPNLALHYLSLKQGSMSGSVQVHLSSLNAHDLLQVSVLRVFHQLLANAPFRKHAGSSEVLRFAVTIVRHIFDRLVPALAAANAGKTMQGECAGSSDRM